MDSLLIAATGDPGLLATILTVTKAVVLVLVGVNMLIIVHEWGHFIVARMCGVRCDKFYIWFDIFGWKLCKFKWGDTEFGVGVLPLGGYVKMLGQEDNPGRLREELERAKAHEAEKQEGATGDQSAAETGEEIDIKAAEAALFDPRSYLSKSVPQRMAIISAGVFMNVVFAAVCAVVAYGMGVYKVDSEIGLIAPGGAAWRADLRAGDRVIEVAGKPIAEFDRLREATMLGDIEDGVPIVVLRPGVDEPVRVVVEPDRDKRLPTIGIGGPDTTTLRDEDPVVFGSPADKGSAPFKAGDVIVAVNGRSVDSGYEFHRCEALGRDEPMEVTVRRTGNKKGEAPEELNIAVPTRPMRRLGLVMESGVVGAIQANSPAEKAGLKPGDRIVELDGEPLGNALTLEDRLRGRFVAAATEPEPKPQSVSLTLQGRTEPVQVELRMVDWYELPMYGTEHASVPSLGITLEVGRRIEAVEEGSPAAAAGIKPGWVVKAVTVVSPDKETRKRLSIPKDLKQPDKQIEFVKDGREEFTWTAFFYQLQLLLPGTTLELEMSDGRTAKLTWVEDVQWHYPERGFQFAPKETFVQAASLGEAISHGIEETKNSLLVVFKFLGKVGTQQISPRMIGGPWTIVKVAYHAASSRFTDLLMFLCIISANLAVINFLPIPVLDGGHMVFLAYEGIRGKPPSENVQVGLSYVGLFLLLGLMVWVFGLDLGLISR